MQVARDVTDFERENFAWLIASVANLAGQKPKLTVDKLMGRKRKPGTQAENLQQNEIAAGLLAGIAMKMPAPVAHAAETGRASASEVEQAQEQARKPRGEVLATAAPGDAPVPVAVAKAKLDEFRAKMRGLQQAIADRKAKGPVDDQPINR